MATILSSARRRLSHAESPIAMAANVSSAAGSTSESRLATASTVLAAKDALHGRLELLARQGAGDRRHCADHVRDMTRRQLRAQAGRDTRLQVVVEHDPVREHDEEDELARAALVVLEMHDETVGDLRQLLDDAVELAGAEAHAAAVERRVGAARDDAASLVGEPDPVALAPDARVRLEVRTAVERPVRVAPELDGHRRHRPCDHELAELADERSSLRVERLRGHAEQAARRSPRRRRVAAASRRRSRCRRRSRRSR